TLVKILMGVEQPDAGELRVDGSTVRIRNPHQARRLGIDAVFQDSSLIPQLSVAENLFLGREREFYRGGLISPAKREARAREALSVVSSAPGLTPPDPTELLSNLDLAHVKLVEIAKAVASGASVLILDEVTALFGQHQIAALFALLRQLKSRDVTTVF